MPRAHLHICAIAYYVDAALALKLYNAERAQHTGPEHLKRDAGHLGREVRTDMSTYVVL